jgi:hypothetical protein
LCFSSDDDDDEDAELVELQEFLGPVFETPKSGYCVEEVLSQYLETFRNQGYAVKSLVLFVLVRLSLSI